MLFTGKGGGEPTEQLQGGSSALPQSGAQLLNVAAQDCSFTLLRLKA